MIHSEFRHPTEEYLRMVRERMAGVDLESRDVVIATAILNAPCDDSVEIGRDALDLAIEDVTGVRAASKS